MDEQIKEKPKCAKCSIELAPGVALAQVSGLLICGGCIVNLHNKAKLWLQEVNLD